MPSTPNPIVMETPDSSGYVAKKRELQSNNEAFLKATVAFAICIALLSLAMSVLLYINVHALEMKLEECVFVTEVDRTTRELTELTGIKADVYREIAEIQSVVADLINNSSTTHSEMMSTVREEIALAKGEC